jgi:23S rRNA pseudouridine2605 synthase
VGRDEEEAIRLQLYLSRSGIASRRACEKLIAEGNVRVNGKTVTQQGVKVVPGKDSVLYRGKPVFPTRRNFYIALHKPVRYICSHRDREGRPLAEDLLKGHFPVRLFNVGRLDYLSSGLILFTNDGEFARIVTHPSLEIEKEYVVECADKLNPELLDQFSSGIRVEGEMYRIKEYRLVSPVKVRLILSEGKNREIRKLFNHVNIKIKRLHRVRIGNIHLGTLATGAYRKLSPREISWLLSKGKGVRD